MKNMRLNRTINLANFNSCSSWVTAGTLLLSASACQDSTKVEEADLPNIIMIVSDDLGYNDLGVYGAKDVISPNLDKLAREGVRFTNFYVTSAGSTPSRGSLLTGRYPQRNGTYALFRNHRVNYGHRFTPAEYSVSWERIGGTDLREVFIQELLKEAGYKTAIFGKWDLGQLRRFLPLQRGFDEYYGFPNTGVDYFTHERYGIPSMYRNNEPTTEDKGTWCDELFEREALRFVEENKDKPFFLYLPFFAPHGHSNFEPDRRGTFPAPPEYLALYPEESIPEEDELRRGWRRGYMASITFMDRAIGNVIGLVESLGLRENTLVIFINDNGGVNNRADNSPFSGGKGSFWEGGIRVPCIINWPGKIQQGVVMDNFISSLEIFPTILDVTGIDKPRDLILDGFNIFPLLTAEKNLERDEMYWESWSGQCAARIGNLKWLKLPGWDKGQLFDLTIDVGEKSDLSTSRVNDYTRLKGKFYNWQDEMDNAEPRGPYKDY